MKSSPSTNPRPKRPVAQQAAPPTLTEEVATPRPAHARSSNDSDALEARIRMRAYDLYRERGYQDGQALEDWLQAEREVAVSQG